MNLKLIQNLKNEKTAITGPVILKSKNESTLFPSIFKVEGNKVFLFFDLVSTGRDIAVLSFLRFCVNFCVMSFSRGIVP